MLVLMLLIGIMEILADTDPYSAYKIELKIWDLENKIYALHQGLKTIDGELEFLYSSLPGLVGVAGAEITAARRQTNRQNSAIGGLNFFGTIAGLGGRALLDIETGTPSDIADLLNFVGTSLQNGIYVFGQAVSVFLNEEPACGIEDFKRSWSAYYDVANLEETYLPVFGRLQQPNRKKRSLGIVEVDYDGWRPSNRTEHYRDLYETSDPSSYYSPEADYSVSDVAYPEYPDYLQQVAEKYSAAVGPISNNYPRSSLDSILNRLNADTMPSVKKVRVFSFRIRLRRSLKCLLDEKVPGSIRLSEHLKHIESTSVTRLSATEKIIKLNIELEEERSGVDKKPYTKQIV